MPLWSLNSYVMAISLAVVLAIVSMICTSKEVSAVPMAGLAPSPISFPVVRKNAKRYTGNQLSNWANNHRTMLQTKYKLQARNKRDELYGRDNVGANSLTNYQHDSTWYTPVQIGTPSNDHNLVLDTGSSDIWVSHKRYEPSDSSSFTNKTSPFDISYGSGTASGYLGTDKFTLAGHTVSDQVFAVADQVSEGLLDDSVTGIMGLGFEALSTSKTKPFWQNAGSDVFAFYLKREINAGNSVSDQSDGGIFTLGGTNSSLFKGDINYSNVIAKMYWLITLGGLSINNHAVDVGSTVKAAIDTGTTLIGGPDSAVESFYSNIEGSKPLSDASGYYTYPCNTDVTLKMTFGNQQYTIASEDFRAGYVDQSGRTCLGSVFSIGSTSSDEMQWIIGDAFLKNVYTVFKNGATPKVGFASLADGLNQETTSKTVAQTETSASSRHVNTGLILGTSVTFATLQAALL